jgi:hypothetical protein
MMKFYSKDNIDLHQMISGSFIASYTIKLAGDECYRIIYQPIETLEAIDQSVNDISFPFEVPSLEALENEFAKLTQCHGTLCVLRNCGRWRLNSF